MTDYYMLAALLLVALAMPIASLVVRWLDLRMPEAEAGPLVFIAALVPAGLVLIACILRMNVRLYSEDWGQVGALYFAFGGFPLSMLLGLVAAAWTVRRARRGRGE